MKNKNTILIIIVYIFILFLSLGFFNINSDEKPSVEPFIQLNSQITKDIGVYKNYSTDNILSGVWTYGANMLIPGYFGGAIGYTKNDTGWLYICGGNAPSGASTTAERYNVRTDTWSNFAPLLTAVVVDGVCKLKDSIFCFGGYNSSSVPINVFNRYDIRSNTWAVRTPIPSTASFCKGVDYQDSLIYVQIGYTGSGVPGSIYLYNAINGTWRAATSLPAGRFGGGFTRSGDTLLYIGGADLSLIYNQTYVGVISQTNRANITWTTKTPCPGLGTSGMYRIDAQPWGAGKIILPGVGSPIISNIECYVYNLSLDTWIQQPFLPISVGAWSSGSVFYSSGIWKLICAGGYTGSNINDITLIYTDTLGLVNVRTNEKSIPESFHLYQNYPNPFNPMTKIKFEIAEVRGQMSEVRLIIYDILGREVATLVNEKLDPGTYEVQWDASNYASGIYFYTLDEGTFKKTMKMVIIK